MTRRINILLPEKTLRAVDKITKPRERSQFIDKAVQYYIAHRSPEALQRQLEAAAIRDRDLDEEIARDWFAVDQHAWHSLEAQESTQPATQSAAKSTSRRSTRR